MTRLVIDPITRIEGHLKIEAILEDKCVRDAYCSGTLFRGIELILRGRDPRDAPLITQRICGVCPVAHAMASTLSLDDAFGVRVPRNGRIIRNLIQGANLIQSHILHFYHLAALDYVDVAQVAGYVGPDPTLNSVKSFLERGEPGPFAPRYEGDYRLSSHENQQATAHYVLALDARRKAHEMLAIFGGKIPHQVGIVPGGATQGPTIDRITSFLWHLNDLRVFIDTVYLPDVISVAGAYPDYVEIGAGCGRFLAYGAFAIDDSGEPSSLGRRWLKGGTCGRDLIAQELDPASISEDVRRAWYADASSGKHPSEGQTLPEPRKESGYTWLKAPRYQGGPHEVGPLARMLVNYAQQHPQVVEAVDGLLSALDLPITALISTMGRHAARALECKIVADAMSEWVLQLEPGAPACVEYEIPDRATGVGLTEAPRGALGHWVTIQDGVIDSYQAVVPTTWNCSPHDDRDQPGPVEQAIIGTGVHDAENPFEVVRIVRSFDPCIACAVHSASRTGARTGGPDEGST